MVRVLPMHSLRRGGRELDKLVFGVRPERLSLWQPEERLSVIEGFVERPMPRRLRLTVDLQAREGVRGTTYYARVRLTHPWGARRAAGAQPGEGSGSAAFVGRSARRWRLRRVHGISLCRMCAH
jgi:hypothetical protein